MSIQYNSNEPDGMGFLYKLIYTGRWQMQSFIPTLDYDLDYLILKGKANSNADDFDVEVHIFACDGSHYPTGNSLGMASESLVDISTTRGEHTWTFDTPVGLAQGQEYCVVASCPLGSSPRRYEWEYNTPTAEYGCTSNNSGATWGVPTTSTGTWFQAWGTEAAGPTPPTDPSPQDDVTNVVLRPTLTWVEGV
jgi:hypothetical protein